MHPPSVDTFLIDVVDRLLIPVCFGECRTSWLPVLQDSTGQLGEGGNLRSVRASDNNPLDLWLFRSRR